MFFDAVENTFKILEERGITREDLYRNAEGDRFNLSLQALCDKLGIEIVYKNDLIDDNGEKISGNSDYENKKIYINSSEIGERMRFTLGHELYHILNGQSENRKEVEKFNKNELIANAFAAELLMPEDMVIKKIKEFGFDIQRLAVYFKVSIPAMFYRLTNLGFLLIS